MDFISPSTCMNLTYYSLVYHFKYLYSNSKADITDDTNRSVTVYMNPEKKNLPEVIGQNVVKRNDCQTEKNWKNNRLK